MTRTLLIFCFAAATLAAKDKAWETGAVLDKTFNPYFRPVDKQSPPTPSLNSQVQQEDSGAVVAVNVSHSSGEVVYESFVIQSDDRVFMVELMRLKSFKAPRLSLSQPVTFAVEKDKLWFKDLDRVEYQTKILKEADRKGVEVAVGSRAPEVEARVNAKAGAKAEAQVEAKADAPKPVVKPQAKPAAAKVQEAKVQKPKPSKPDSVFATGALSPEDLTIPRSKPERSDVEALVQPEPKAAAKAAAKKAAPQVQEAVVEAPRKTELAPKPEPLRKPEPVRKAEPEKREPEKKADRQEARREPATRASSKDRPWQSGRLVSVSNNNYFLNVTYTSDLDGSNWPLVEGSDGRYTVDGQIGNPTNSMYTYDNYIIESDFVAYLVQRMRPKTSQAAVFPGTHPLKFAVEKNKLYVLDDNDREFETKVIKLIQRDAIVDPLARAAAR